MNMAVSALRERRHYFVFAQVRLAGLQKIGQLDITILCLNIELHGPRSGGCGGGRLTVSRGEEYSQGG